MRSMRLESLLLSGPALARGVALAHRDVLVRGGAHVRGSWAMICMGAAATLSARAVLLGRVLFYLLVMTILGTFWDGVATEHASDVLTLPTGIVLYVGVAECITLSVPA